MIATSADVSHQIRRRARIFALTSWLLLGTIVSTLLVAAILFRTAGDLVFADAEKAALQRREAIQELRFREERLEEKIAKLTKNYAFEIERAGRTEPGAGLIARGLSDEIEIATNDRDSVREALTIANREPERQSKVELLSPEFLTSTATRVAILLTLILLLRILAGLHIYTFRLAAHFHTIADAIQLNQFGSSVEGLVPLIQAMSAQRIGFPGVKEHPVDSIREMVAAANLSKRDTK
jgi:hypothetical protein